MNTDEQLINTNEQLTTYSFTNMSTTYSPTVTQAEFGASTGLSYVRRIRSRHVSERVSS